MNEVEMNDEVLLTKLDNDGFVLIKDVFDPERLEQIRNFVNNLSMEEKEDQDLMNHKPIRDIFFDDRFVKKVLNPLLGTEPIYFGEGNIMDSYKGTGGYHEDSKVSDDDRVNAEHPILVIAMYLQDHKNFSGGIKVRKGSHKYKMWGKDPKLKEGLRYAIIKGILSMIAFKRIKLIKSFASKYEYLSNYRFLDFRQFSLSPYTKGTNVSSEIGDVVAWYVRTYHCGRFVRMKFFRNLCLPPIIEKLLPKFLQIPRERQRVALLTHYGREFPRLNEYIVNRVNSPSKGLFETSNLGTDEIHNLAMSKGVKLDISGIDLAKSKLLI